MRVAVVLALVLALGGCKSDPKKGFEDVPPIPNLEETLIAHQRALLKKDSLIIEEFIKTQNWTTAHSGTGLRYEVYKTTKLDSVRTGEQVFLDYTITNLALDTLYSSQASGVMSLVVDYSQAESGLHELLKQMKRGEKARAVIPAHLAHGLVGDDYKIPPNTSITFDVTILE